MAGFTVERAHWPVEHKCPKPNRRERKQLGLKSYAVIRCETCGQRWMRYPIGGWDRIYPEDD